jgi:hypothetical protein
MGGLFLQEMDPSDVNKWHGNKLSFRLCNTLSLRAFWGFLRFIKGRFQLLTQIGKLCGSSQEAIAENIELVIVLHAL